MERELEVARNAALEAGKIVMKYYGRVDVGYKKDGSLVTAADKEAEERIRSLLSGEFPDYSFLGEESGLDKRKSDFRWVVDPLDGTTNYAMKNPLFAVSIALVRKDEPVMGVIFCPVQGELFTAVRGGGAFLNGKRVRVSDRSGIEDAHIAFCHEKGPENVERVSRIFRTFKMTGDTFRQMGSSELELAYLAAGRLDAFMSVGLKPWDVAAGTVIVREAGGKVTDFGGKEFDMSLKDILASNGKIHSRVSEMIKAAVGS